MKESRQQNISAGFTTNEIAVLAVQLFFISKLNFMTTKFQKKSIIVEAVQLTNENKDQVLTWAQQMQMNVYPSFDKNGSPVIRIPTLEGEMDCSIGDFIIVEPFPTDWRKLYPCKPDIFEQTYESVVNEC